MTKEIIEALETQIDQMKQLTIASEETVRVLKRGFYPASATQHIQPLINFNKNQAQAAKAAVRDLSDKLHEAQEAFKSAEKTDV